MLGQLVVAFSTLAVAFSAPAWNELHGYTFEKYVEDFGHEWTKESPEWEMRRSVFVQELARVQAHNVRDLSWKEGINKFSAMFPDEKKAYRGRSKGVARNHKPKFAKSFDLPMKPVSALPASVDWRKAGIISPVKDQGACGSCWAFASTAVLESAAAQATGLLFELSPQQIAMCSPNPDSCGGTGGCQGATAEIAFDYVASSAGMYQEYQIPYASYNGKNTACTTTPTGVAKVGIDGYVQLPSNNYTALMNAVATVGPIAVSVDASWGGYTSGIFSGCNPAQNVDIDHAVVLVGYGEENGEKYWLVRNSWSPTWGEKGYIRLARHDNDDSNCATDSTPADGTACAGDDTPQKVCGTCGILFDSAYVTGAHLV